ncbi:hypothetical protein HOLleu_11408 [Holothuria leucospilota]|uniref:Transposase domain-containing protein n=1 Tax=Holothuria leucospilota TaxID=206669 RepID=A0A9Q1HFJ8_HOLLE|nr:hypothetical protein HOLleu_11408 [Holothuria leucospilota]
MAFSEYSDRTKRRRINVEVDELIASLGTNAAAIHEPEFSNSEKEQENIAFCIPEFLEDVSVNQFPNETEENDSEICTRSSEQAGANWDHRNDALQVFDSERGSSSGESDTDLPPPVQFSDSSDANVEPDLVDELSNWSIEHNISHTALSGLLNILKGHHPELPRDPRTLLGTTTSHDIKSISGGSYFHFGVQTGLLSKVHLLKFLDPANEIHMQINIDGLPLFKSANDQFWPILGMISNCELKEPFVIGLFYGKCKPCDLTFLEEFVSDIRNLQNNGLMYKEKNIPFKVTAVLCDTPARALVKRVKGHSGYSGCDKCTQRGVYLDKITFPEMDAPLRTDASFLDMIDEAHHLGPTPLNDLNIGMVSAFPLDYMHLACLGVMRRLIRFWVKGPLKTRLGPRVVQEISRTLVTLKEFIPSEFARKPRELKDFERWKATEFRQFLLYTGPLALLGKLSDPLYQNFLLLSVSMYILLSPKYCLEYCQYARSLLVMFVQHFGQIYGKNMITYNVHGLIHLPFEVHQFGALDNISCFPFESYLGRLKRVVRKPSFPLEQAVRRLLEEADKRQLQPVQDAPVLYRKMHHAGPNIPGIKVVSMWKEIQMKKFKTNISKGNNCVQIGNEIVLVRNFITSTQGSFVLYQKFKERRDFFQYPLDSSQLGIVLVSNLSDDMQYAPVEKISEKLVLLPFKTSFLAVPMLH